MDSDDKCILWAYLHFTGNLNKPAKKLEIHITIDDGAKVAAPICDGSELVKERSRLLTFQISSTLRIDVIRKSQLRALGIKHVKGHFIGKAGDLIKQDGRINLNDAKGIITVQLLLSSDHAKVIMEGVNGRLASLDGNTTLNQVSDDLDRIGFAATKLHSAAQNLGNVLTPFGQALQLMVKIGDSLADAHPLLKTSWIILSSVYKAVQNQKLQDDNIRDLADSLREMLGAASACPDLKDIENTTRVTESIGKTALDVALLIEECTRYSSLPARIAQAQLKDLGPRVTQSKKECVDLMMKFDRRVHIENRANLKEVKDTLDTELEQKKKDKIWKWLDAPDPSGLCTTASEKHFPGSGSWFLTSTEYVEWKRSADIPLVIWGAPGFGKTVLCSTIIDNIKDYCSRPNSKSAYAYFFFDGRNSQAEFQHHGKAISALIWQLCRQGPSIPSALQWLYKDGTEQKTLKRLHLTLEMMIQEFDDDIYIIIDSLDECSERMSFLPWITELSDQKEGKLHLLVTSRPEHNIRQRLEAMHKISVDMEESSVSQDLRNFVDEKIQTSFELRKLATITDIGTAVMMGANGMFSLVAYRLDELQSCVSLADVKKKLKDLPKNLDEMYHRMINQVEPIHRHQVLLILQWLAFSMRTLTLREIAEVVLVNFSGRNKVYFDPDCRLTEPEDIFGICGGLVSGSQGEVKISHLSIKEYLLSERRHLESSPLYLNAALAHSAISQTCLVYLLQLTDTNGQDKNKCDLPLASYAAHNWFSHATCREDGEPNDFQHDLILKLLVSNPKAFEASLQLHDLEAVVASSVPFKRHYPFPPGPITASPLYYSSLMGLTCVIPAIMDLGYSPIPQEKVIFGNALQAASACGNVEIVRVLLDNGVDPNVKGGHFNSALIAATSRNHTAVAQLLLERNADPNPCEPYNPEFWQTSRTPLHIACESYYPPNMPIIDLLLRHGVDINACNGDNVNTLEMLIMRQWGGDIKLVKLLLDSGANPNHQGEGRALQAAALNGNVEIIELLLEHNADPSAPGGHKNLGSAIHAASASGNYKIIEILLNKGANNINSQLGKYGSVLQAASANRHFDIIKYLLEHGADPKIEGGDYEDVLISVATAGDVLIMQLLLEKGANPRTPSAQHALQIASANGNAPIVELLLMNGADPNIYGSWYGTALQAASQNGFSTIVGLVLEHGGNPNLYAPEFSSPLYIAADEGYLTIVELLLEKGANPHTNGGRYKTALHAASNRGHSKIVELLLKKGSNPDTPGAVGHGNAIHIAATNGHEAIIRLLLNYGADVHAEGAKDALLVASAEGHANIVKLLLDKGADPNIQHGWYGAALHAASLGGFEDIIVSLLEKGANLNTIAGHYGTVLQAAAANGQTAIVTFLLDKGADPNRCGGWYKTALEAASDGGHRETVELLLKRGADPDIVGGCRRSALEAASLGGHIDIFRLLLAKGANPDIQGESTAGILAAVLSGDAELVELLIRNQNIQDSGQYESAMKVALSMGHKEIFGLLYMQVADIEFAKLAGSGEDDNVALALIERPPTPVDPSN